MHRHVMLLYSGKNHNLLRIKNKTKQKKRDFVLLKEALTVNLHWHNQEKKKSRGNV